MEDGNYITIQGWMRKKLDLKGNELLTYALIYGFSQDGESAGYTGSAEYIAEWLGVSRRTVFTTLQELCSKGLIEKKTTYINNMKYPTYRVCNPFVSGENISQGDMKNLHGGYENFSPNKIADNTREIINSKENIKEHALTFQTDDDTPSQSQKEKQFFEAVQDCYNSTCYSMPKCTVLTDKRKTSIKTITKLYGASKFRPVFEAAEASDFLSGRSGRWKGCNFDWLMNKNNFIKVLEGTYTNGTQTKSSRDTSQTGFISTGEEISSL